MQSEIEPLLREAFLAAIPAADNNTAFENQGFNPAGKAKWYIFSFLPNSPEVATLGKKGSDKFTGLVQVDINISAGRGKAGVESDIELLRETFAAGSRFTNENLNLMIRSCGRSGPGRKVDSFYRYSVTIVFESRVRRNLIDLAVDFVLWDDGEAVLWGDGELVLF